MVVSLAVRRTMFALRTVFVSRKAVALDNKHHNHDQCQQDEASFEWGGVGRRNFGALVAESVAETKEVGSASAWRRNVQHFLTLLAFVVFANGTDQMTVVAVDGTILHLSIPAGAVGLTHVDIIHKVGLTTLTLAIWLFKAGDGDGFFRCLFQFTGRFVAEIKDGATTFLQ